MSKILWWRVTSLFYKDFEQGHIDTYRLKISIYVYVIPTSCSWSSFFGKEGQVNWSWTDDFDLGVERKPRESGEGRASSVQSPGLSVLNSSTKYRRRWTERLKKTPLLTGSDGKKWVVTFLPVGTTSTKTHNPLVMSLIRLHAVP